MDDDAIARARAAPIEDEIARRGVKLRGGVDRCGPCPVCGGVDRFSINTRKQVFNCRGCARAGDVIALVEFLDGVAFSQAVHLLAGERDASPTPCGSRREPAPRIPGRPPPALWPALWRRAVDPRGTLVERYLRVFRHGLELPPEAAGEAIRFDARCRFGSGADAKYHPAMVCLIRNIVTNEPQGLQRTALTPDGDRIRRDGKTLRMSLGRVAGGAIKIDPDEHAAQGVVIGEGLETTLAGRQKGYAPAWAVISAAGVEHFPVLPGLDGLTIHRENDANEASQKAATACADRWHEAGLQVVFVDPDPEFNDLNDEIGGTAT